MIFEGHWGGALTRTFSFFVRGISSLVPCSWSSTSQVWHMMSRLRGSPSCGPRPLPSWRHLPLLESSKKTDTPPPSRRLGLPLSPLPEQKIIKNIRNVHQVFYLAIKGFGVLESSSCLAMTVFEGLEGHSLKCDRRLEQIDSMDLDALFKAATVFKECTGGAGWGRRHLRSDERTMSTMKPEMITQTISEDRNLLK